jgi:hypothetical protein
MQICQKSAERKKMMSGFAGSILSRGPTYEIVNLTALTQSVGTRIICFAGTLLFPDNLLKLPEK